MLSVKIRLHAPSTSPFLRAAPLIFFDGHFDGQNGCATHLAHQMSVTVGTMLNFAIDFVKLVDSDATCKQTLRYRQIDSFDLDGEIRMMKSLPGKSVSQFWAV